MMINKFICRKPYIGSATPIAASISRFVPTPYSRKMNVSFNFIRSTTFWLTTATMAPYITSTDGLRLAFHPTNNIQLYHKNNWIKKYTSLNRVYEKNKIDKCGFQYSPGTSVHPLATSTAVHCTKNNNINKIHTNNDKMNSMETKMRQDALEIIHTSIQAVDPKVAIHSHLSHSLEKHENILYVKNTFHHPNYKKYNESDYDNIVIIAFGKASMPMTEAVCEVLSKSFPNLHMNGITIIKDDHASQQQIQELENIYNIQTYTASHPVPDERSVEAASHVFDLISKYTADNENDYSPERTFLVTLISGGGSALFCSPRPPLTLNDLSITNSVLLGSGMTIQQMNVIRKRLEAGTKGGQLATLAYPCTILTCVLSDVIGDPLDLIASGPTIPDDYKDDAKNRQGTIMTWKDVWKLIEEYDLQQKLPEPVIELLRKGNNGELEDTPKASHPTFQNCETVLVGNNQAAVMAAAKKAEDLGYNPVILGTCIEGEAQHVANVYVAMAQNLQMQHKQQQENKEQNPYMMASLPVALIAGGETTVSLPTTNTGKGGRNQEIGLAAALTMQKMDMHNVILASIGTDGTDGPTDAAGAIVDGGTINQIEKIQKNNFNDSIQLSGLDALKSHDAYTFFDSGVGDDSVQALVKTGPTGTNVADVCVVLVKPPNDLD